MRAIISCGPMVQSRCFGWPAIPRLARNGLPGDLLEADIWSGIVSEYRSIDPILAPALHFICCMCNTSML